MQSDALHALVAGVILVALYYGANLFGLLETNSRLKKFGIIFAICFPVLLVINLLFPTAP